VRAAALRDEIEEHNRRYFVDDEPTVSDADYDALVRELKAIEAEFPEVVTPDSPTQHVGGFASAQFSEVRHRVPMMSLDNAFGLDELREWGKRVERRLAEGGDTSFPASSRSTASPSRSRTRRAVRPRPPWQRRGRRGHHHEHRHHRRHPEEVEGKGPSCSR
jgi:DNA ligase (NAD+)